jgi:hypothetical protein
MTRQLLSSSRSRMCRQLNFDIWNYCSFNPFRNSKAVKRFFDKAVGRPLVIRQDFFRNIFSKADKKLNRVFYKRKKYFSNLIFYKRRIKFFLGFITKRHINKLAIEIYKLKSLRNIHVFDAVVRIFELRLDFFSLRLRYAFNIKQARDFVIKYGFLINGVLFKDYERIIELGDIVQPGNLYRLHDIYLSYYLFWYGEFIYRSGFIRSGVIMQNLFNYKRLKFFARKSFGPRKYFRFNRRALIRIKKKPSPLYDRYIKFKTFNLLSLKLLFRFLIFNLNKKVKKRILNFRFGSLKKLYKGFYFYEYRFLNLSLGLLKFLGTFRTQLLCSQKIVYNIIIKTKMGIMSFISKKRINILRLSKYWLKLKIFFNVLGKKNYVNFYTINLLLVKYPFNIFGQWHLVEFFLFKNYKYISFFEFFVNRLLLILKNLRLTFDNNILLTKGLFSKIFFFSKSFNKPLEKFLSLYKKSNNFSIWLSYYRLGFSKKAFFFNLFFRKKSLNPGQWTVQSIERFWFSFSRFLRVDRRNWYIFKGFKFFVRNKHYKFRYNNNSRKFFSKQQFFNRFKRFIRIPVKVLFRQQLSRFLKLKRFSFVFFHRQLQYARRGYLRYLFSIYNYKFKRVFKSRKGFIRSLVFYAVHYHFLTKRLFLLKKKRRRRSRFVTKNIKYVKYKIKRKIFKGKKRFLKGKKRLFKSNIKFKNKR